MLAASTSAAARAAVPSTSSALRTSAASLAALRRTPPTQRQSPPLSPPLPLAIFSSLHTPLRSQSVPTSRTYSALTSRTSFGVAASLRLQRHSTAPSLSSSSFHTTAASRIPSPAASAVADGAANAVPPATEFASQVGGSASWFAGIPQIGACFEAMRPIVHHLPDYFGQTGPHAYAVSIVLLALLVRVTVALPLAIWSRRRAQRMQEVVLPTWRRVAPELAKAIGMRFRRDGKSHAEYTAALPAEANAVRKSLIRKHSCHPYMTIATNVCINMPIFLFVAGSLRYGLLPPSPMIDEVIPWWSPSPELLRAFEADKQLLLARGLEPEALAQLTAPIGPSLAASDKQIWAPLSLGMLYLANTELLAWKRRQDEVRAASASATDGAQKEATKPTEKQAAVPAVSSRMDNVYRFLVMLMVPVATTLPSGVLIYWLASGTWNLANTIVTTILDKRRQKVVRIDEDFVRKTLTVEGSAAARPIRNSRRRAYE